MKKRPNPTAADIDAARRVLEDHGWRCVPPSITTRVVFWTKEGEPRGAMVKMFDEDEDNHVKH